MVANWDLVLLVFFASTLLFSLLLKERILVVLLGAYVGMAVANQWGESLYQLVNKGATILNQDVISGKISIVAVQIVAFALVLLIVAFKGGLLVHPAVTQGFMGYIGLIAYGLLTGALIAWTIMNYLPSGIRESIVLGSQIADKLMAYGGWWVALPVVVMIIVNFRNPEV
jgi:hypothetical protein